MTRSEKLDRILLLLIGIDQMELDNKIISKKITMEFINDSQILELVPWEMKSLRDELVNEKYVEIRNGELKITALGKTFITRGKGYKYRDKVDSQEDTIREKTIEKFKYDKFSFWVSIIAIGIAGLSLLMTILKP